MTGLDVDVSRSVQALLFYFHNHLGIVTPSIVGEPISVADHSHHNQLDQENNGGVKVNVQDALMRELP